MLSSDMSCFLASGLYKIFSVAFPGQDADLFGAQSTANVVGYHNNSNSMNMVWNLTNVNGLSSTTLVPQMITLVSAAAPGTYASVDNFVPGAVVHGSPNGTIWTLVQVVDQNECQYQIQAPGLFPSYLTWFLGKNVDNTPITLAPTNCNVSTSLTSGVEGISITNQPGCNTTQVWTFKKVETTMARGINDLD